MAKYAAEINRTASATLSVGTLCADATTPRRQKLYELIFGSEATPADNAFLWQAQRATTQGTGTTVTAPPPLDAADAAALADVLENHTVDPTLTANTVTLSIALNQRATFRWVAAPGSELVIPATANNGYAIRTPTAGGLVAVTATLLFEEQ
jgi:hypothetical protein